MFLQPDDSSWYILLDYQLRSHEDVLHHNRNQVWLCVAERQNFNLGYWTENHHKAAIFISFCC